MNVRRRGWARAFSFFAGLLGILGANPAELRAEMSKSWAAIASVTDRFTVLSTFNNEAVLDRETGLVWAQKPLVFSTVETFSATALSFCSQYAIGGRYGWRPPSHAEQASLLVDSSGAPVFPAGHPFVFHYYDVENNGALSPIDAAGLSGVVLFTTSTGFSTPNFYKTIVLGTPPQVSFNSILKEEFTAFNKGGIWCVRGGSGYNGP